MLHKNIPELDRHSPFNWVVLDTAARDALVVTAADLYKACYLVGDGSVHILTDESPMTWAEISGGGGGVVARPAFKAYRSTDQTGIANGVATKIIFDTEIFDSTGTYNNATGRWTPGVAGYCQINTSLYAVQTSGTILQVLPYLYKNNVVYSAGGRGAVLSGTARSNHSDVVYLDVADYVEIFAYIDGGASSKILGGQITSWFSGVYIGT